MHRIVSTYLNAFRVKRNQKNSLRNALLFALIFFCGNALVAQAFITTWFTGSVGSGSINPNPREITIPTFSDQVFTNGFTYDYTVDWGDGSSDTNVTGNISHEYAEIGTYTVTITGLFPKIHFNNNNDEKLKIRTVEQWGNNPWVSMDGAFAGCVSLRITATDAPILSNVTSTNRMFDQARALEDENFNNWDMSNVTNTGAMFRDANNFVGSIGDWNMSNVTNMERMFEKAWEFNGDIGNWNTSAVTTTNWMFLNAFYFNQDIGNWDMSSLVSSRYMFDGAGRFNKDISGWNVSNLKFMQGMFRNTFNFNQPIGTWNTVNVENMAEVFQKAKRFNQDLTGWNTANVWNMINMFNGAERFNANIATWDLSSLTRMDFMFKNTLAFDQDISTWNVSNVGNMRGMFEGTASFNQDIGSWDVSNVNRMDTMFKNAAVFNQNIGGWNVGNVSNMNQMFMGVTLTPDIYDAILIGWNSLPLLQPQVSFHGGNSMYCFAAAERNNIMGSYGWNITDGGPGCSFYQGAFITTWKTDNTGITNNDQIRIPITATNFDYDVHWGDGTFDRNVTGAMTHTYDTSGTYQVTILRDFRRILFNNGGDKNKILTIEQWGDLPWANMENAFYGCINLTITASDAPNLSNVFSANQMFRGANSLSTGSFSSWDVSNITDMGGMFRDASSFVGDLSNWNVSNVLATPGMFRGCTAFNSPLNDWNVSNVQQMFNMFRDASSFDQDLNNWNVSNVLRMYNMFYGATNFNGDISSWDVSNVFSFGNMFNSAINFDGDIGGWNVSSGINMPGMFNGATSFDQDLGGWNVSTVQIMTDMFLGVTLSAENYDNLLIGWNNLTTLQSGISFHGGNSVYCLGETARNELIVNNGWTIMDGGKLCTLKISAKVLLQGALFDPIAGEELLMRDQLRTNGYIPTATPYSDGKTCDATLFDLSGNDAIVDWVFVELRDSTDNTLVIDAQSALLQRDGDVVDIDGTSNIAFAQPIGDYHLAIKHRNHLGIITANPVSLSTSVSLIDFTNANDDITFGSEAQTSHNTPVGTLAMWAGDANADGRIIFLNTGAESVEIKQRVLDVSAAESPFGASPFYIVQGYYAEDVDLDGRVIFLNDGNELIYVKDNVLTHPSNQLFNSPFYIIIQQLP